ncbi:hypothetical protein NA898_10790 [Proteus cibi]|uniref:Uncharacterized protein n=1 Tax=Proteus cibi TaxID=2050966 RepID=A0ABU6EEM0_9GAMM|nr:hypothetical protein [Proteus cibi]MEB6857517.1 hypothetical protein [Proteus cibi]MEB7089036.1 hypothetical protein [Proteus cibi]
MGIGEVNLAVTTSVNNIENKIEVEYKKTLSYIKDLESILNTNLNLRIGENKKTASGSNISKYIGGCQNKLKNSSSDYSVLDNKLDGFSNKGVNEKSNEIFNEKNNLSIFDDLAGELNSLFDNNESLNKKVSINGSVNINSIENQTIEKKENTNVLPDWITDSGRKELNTDQKLYFKSEKKRSFKNLIKNLFSPFKFINRSLLPIKINFENKNVNKELNTFRFDNVSSNNEAFNNYSNKLNQLNKTFNDNINQIISKKTNSNKKIDIMIKYHTLEKALECKLINDIKLINNELKTDLAKNKFQENYSDLPDKIMSKLNISVNSNVDELFSSNTIDDLKSLLKEKVNSQDKNVKVENFIDNVVDSVMNEKNKLVINKRNDGNFNDVRKELSLNLTKELFNQLSKDEKFIGEEGSISKIDNLIRMLSKDIYKNIGDPTDNIINSLNNSFYENIKQNDNGSDFLVRLFKNSSNNINYKWAQDAIVLLISYGSFENKSNETTEYFSNGKVTDGGNGTISTQKTVVENKLKGIFNRLGLNGDDLDKSKDEVLRKYFANYFEHY